MRATAKYDLNIEDFPPSRKRLFLAHQELGSWQAVADEIGLNWRYVWNYAIHGELPRNESIRRKLIGRKTIDEHLSGDKIREMPPPLLNWAFQNRQKIN
jgi:hypothetical protein